MTSTKLELHKTSLVLKIIAVLWMVWVFLDYWFKHPLYPLGVTNTFMAIPLMHMMIGVIAYIVIDQVSYRRISWLTCIGMFLAFLWGGTLVNLLLYSPVDYSFMSILSYIGRTILFAIFLALLTLSAKQLGGFIVNGVLLPGFNIATSVHIALGLCCFMILIFIILAFHVFHPVVIGLILFFPIPLFYKNTWEDISRLHKPIGASDRLSIIGIVSLILIILMNAMTFAHTLSPFPVGFDAQNYYINLPKLMTEAGMLQKGYQPYNWSLLQSAAYGLVGRVEMLLILSWFGLILVQWCTYEVGTRLMKIPRGLVLLGVALFTYMPSVTTQASQELKVDLGLTFMLLAMVLSGFALLKNLRERPTRQSMVGLAVIVGVLGGIALGIKLTAVIALFAFIAILWYQGLGRLGFLGVFFISMAIVFFAQLDTRAGLRVYHSSVSWLQVVALFIGIGCLFYAIKEHTRKGLKLLYLSVVIAMSCSIVFVPWMIKNYTEIKNPSFIQLLNGTNHGPVMNMKVIDRNYKKSKE